MRRPLFLCVLLLVGLPALAQRSNTPGVEAWALRLGIADDPDQALLGVQIDLGEITDGVRFRPDAQLGVGDDHTILSVSGVVDHPFDTDTAFRPYAGGGLTVGFVDRDRPGPGGDDTDVEIALEAIGGLEWSLRGGNDFFVELNLVFGDLHDVELLAGWRF